MQIPVVEVIRNANKHIPDLKAILTETTTCTIIQVGLYIPVKSAEKAPKLSCLPWPPVTLALLGNLTTASRCLIASIYSNSVRHNTAQSIPFRRGTMLLPRSSVLSCSVLRLALLYSCVVQYIVLVWCPVVQYIVLVWFPVVLVLVLLCFAALDLTGR
jgi:hypothetical protein